MITMVKKKEVDHYKVNMNPEQIPNLVDTGAYEYNWRVFSHHLNMVTCISGEVVVHLSD